MKIFHHRSHNAHQPNPEIDPKAMVKGLRLKDEFTKETLMTSALSFAESKAKNTGYRLMSELDFNDISRHHKSEADKILNLSEGTALFIALDNRVYDSSSPFVKNAEIRMALSDKLQRENPKKKIVWIENVGVAEPGSGFFATVPVIAAYGGTIAAGFGFSVGTILRYRTCQAVVTENAKKAKLRLASLKVLPFNAGGAATLREGQEFEISGQGKLRGDVNLALRYGAGVGAVAIAGFAENLGPVATAAAEYSINVMGLGNNSVRVTIRKIDQESMTMVSNLAAGLIFPGNGLFPGNFGWPQFGHGILKYFAEHRGSPNFEAYLSDYTTLALNCSLTVMHKHLHISSFDIDLSNPRAALAYDALMRLDIRAANERAAFKDGVRKADFKERQKALKAAVRLALCTEKLFLVEALRYESHGELIDGQGHHTVYRDATYKKHVENYLTGRHDALWEAVEIKKDDGEPKTFYRFNYQKEDFFTRQSEINTFFQFAEAIGIKRDKEAHEEVVKMHAYQKLFSHADDTTLNVDIYFTDAGIQRLRAMKAPEMIKAFINTRAHFDPDIKQFPLFSSDRTIRFRARFYLEHYKLMRHHPHHGRMKSLKRIYARELGRDLKTDFQALKKAEHFANLSRYLLDANESQDKVGKFFTALGKSRRPPYTQLIPTLVQLAGRDNVLVHSLSARGGGVFLESVDEGALSHPRQEMVKLCLKKVEP